MAGEERRTKFLLSICSMRAMDLANKRAVRYRHGRGASAWSSRDDILLLLCAAASTVSLAAAAAAAVAHVASRSAVSVSSSRGRRRVPSAGALTTVAQEYLPNSERRAAA